MTPKCSITLNRPFVFRSRFVVRDLRVVPNRCRFREIDGVLKYIVIRSILHGCYDLVIVIFSMTETAPLPNTMSEINILPAVGEEEIGMYILT